MTSDIDVTLFASRVRRDGNTLEIDTLNPDSPEVPNFSGFQLSGNHRTINELEDKGSISVQAYGGVIKYNKQHFNIGLNVLSNQFGNSIQRSDVLSNKFRFRGDHLNNVSIDFQYRHKNINIFGESAISASSASENGTGHLVGALLGLSRKLSASIMYRNYGVRYNSIFPNSFGESTSANNENGIYLGLEYRIDRKWTMRAYADFWRHPWVRFGISRPSTGREFLYRVDYYLCLLYTSPSPRD